MKPNAADRVEAKPTKIIDASIIGASQRAMTETTKKELAAKPLSERIGEFTMLVPTRTRERFKELVTELSALEAKPPSTSIEAEPVFLGPLPGESIQHYHEVNKKALGLDEAKPTDGLAEAVEKIKALNEGTCMDCNDSTKMKASVLRILKPLLQKQQSEGESQHG